MEKLSNMANRLWCVFDVALQVYRYRGISQNSRENTFFAFTPERTCVRDLVASSRPTKMARLVRKGEETEYF